MDSGWSLYSAKAGCRNDRKMQDSGKGMWRSKTGFAEKQGMSAAEVLKKIKGFKRRLEKGISLYLHNAKDTTGIQEVIKYVRSLEKK